MRTLVKVLVAALAIGCASPALAQATQSPGQANVASRIASHFVGLAGSEENALALVNALRTGESVQLTYAPTGTSTTPTIATIDPPTGHMGWGNVRISLALAADQLARLGITNPTAEQLRAALNGGSVTVTNAEGVATTTQLRGVLQMRADGMGWGQIAKAGGTRLGPVVSDVKMGNAKGVTTAAGATASSAQATPKGKGVTTAAGGTTTTTTAAKSASRGITTAQGALATGHGQGHGQGRGVVNAGGSSAGQASHGHGHGRGVVTASGGGAVQVQHGRSGGSAGLVTAQGNAGGNGNGRGNAGGNGKGKGG